MTGILQTAEVVREARSHSMQQTDWTSGMVQTRVVDARVPRVFLLEWVAASPATVAALRQHFAAGGEFSYTPPNDGSALKCVHGTELTVTAESNRIARASLTIEQVLTSDT